MIKFSSNLTRNEVTVSNGTIIRALTITLGFIIFVAFLTKITDALILLVISFFLALALNAPVNWIATHLPRRKGHEHRLLGTIISFVAVVVVLGGFIATITPPIVNQTKNFVNNVPQYVSQIQDDDSSFSRLIHRYHLESEVQQFSDQVKDKLSNFTGTAVDTLTTIIESIVALLSVLVLTFLMLVEGPRWFRYGVNLLPRRYERRASRLAADMYKVVRGYVNGQVILAAIAAALIAPMLFILHISYPVALIFVIFLCGLIPFVGHTIGAIIVTLVSLFTSPVSAVIILAYYILYINIENYVIQPRLQSFTTNMTPLMVFGALIVGVSFGGVLGGLLAIPAAGCIKVLLVDYINRKDVKPVETYTLTNGTK